MSIRPGLKLGSKQGLIGAKDWPSLRIRGRPKEMPNIPRGRKIIGGVKHAGKNEHLFECETLEQMQALYDEHACNAVISWYHVGVFVIPLQTK